MNLILNSLFEFTVIKDGISQAKVAEEPLCVFFAAPVTDSDQIYTALAEPFLKAGFTKISFISSLLAFVVSSNLSDSLCIEMLL
jgi:hypothetical protein